MTCTARPSGSVARNGLSARASGFSGSNPAPVPERLGLSSQFHAVTAFSPIKFQKQIRLRSPACCYWRMLTSVSTLGPRLRANCSGEMPLR